MGDRRMISRTVVDSARFLKMPATSQNLYFHLVVNADDDGIVEAYKVMTMGAWDHEAIFFFSMAYNG